MNTRITLSIADKEFNISCESSQKGQIIEAAQMVDKSMAEVKKLGKTVGADKIAIMAALNIANELLTVNKEKTLLSDSNADTVAKIIDDIDLAIDKFEHN